MCDIKLYSRCKKKKKHDSSPHYIRAFFLSECPASTFVLWFGFVSTLFFVLAHIAGYHRINECSPFFLLLVVRTQTTHNLARPPDLLLVDLLELLRQVLAVRRTAVELQAAARLGTVAYALVQLLKDGQVGLLEHLGPVKSTTTSGGRACVVHVVHTICTDSTF